MLPIKQEEALEFEDGDFVQVTNSVFIHTWSAQTLQYKTSNNTGVSWVGQSMEIVAKYTSILLKCLTQLWHWRTIALYAIVTLGLW